MVCFNVGDAMTAIRENMLLIEIDHDMANVGYRTKPLLDTKIVGLGPSVSLLVFCAYLMIAI